MAVEARLDKGISSAAEVETSPAGVLKRWLAELDLADSAESDWRKAAERIWSLYRSENVRANSFNILWSNTETLRPALYNSPPIPDVRRRFRDKDPVGKAASNVLERSLAYSIDAYDFDHTIQDVVLDVLLPGRGVARIKYVPKFRPMATAPEALGTSDEPQSAAPDTLDDGEPDWLMDSTVGERAPAGEPVAPPPTQEEVYDESAECAHVAWDDFRRGPGKTWDEVQWVAFAHDLLYDQLVSMFGEEIAQHVPLAELTVGDTKKSYDQEVRNLLKTAKVWEIWDKGRARVLFICEGFKHGPLAELDDPLRLKGFFPMPRPVYAIEDSESLIPRMLYDKYAQQAEELNRVTARINKIVDALKVRGAYASNLAEVAKIIEAEDNAMLPIENASEVATLGGLDKAIWIMPIEKLILVVKELYISRKEIIQSIYEITGLGDIMRGVSNPHETLGAQKIKNQWGTMRLQRLQREIQRFVRDIMRMKAEVIGEHFSPETLANITGIKLFPTVDAKQQAQMMIAQQQQPQQPGQPPVAPQVPPEIQKMLEVPTWEEIMALLKDDNMRLYRVDIETDSTVQETLERDVNAKQEALTAIVNLFTGMGPAVQMGVLDVEVVKELANDMARHAKMGQAVEDAIDKIQQPPPMPAEQQPPDFSREVAQIKVEGDKEIAALKEQMATQQAQNDAATNERVKAVEAQRDVAIANAQEQSKTAIAVSADNAKREIAAMQEQTKLTIADNKNATDLQIAGMKVDSDKETAAMKAESDKHVAGMKVSSDMDVKTHKIESDKELGKEKLTHDTALKARQQDHDFVLGAGELEQQGKAEENKAEAAQTAEQKLETMLKLLTKMAGPRKIKFDVGKDGLPVGATISNE